MPYFSYTVPMENKRNEITNILPGILVCVILASISTVLHSYIPAAGAAVIAMFLGMIWRGFKAPSSSWIPGMTFTSKKLLKFAIILLGGSLNMVQLRTVGAMSFRVMVFTLLSAFLSAFIVGKYLMKINFNQRNLIAVGTGICGGSAIAALSPILEAEEDEIAYAISATFLFDIIGVVLFPLMGHLLQLSDMGYGLWAGTAVNDTSSVVAAGYTYSQAAGDYATIVKMARTTMILPIGLLLNAAVLVRNRRSGESRSGSSLNAGKIIPWFILVFCGVVALNTAFPFPPALSGGMKQASAFIITMALASIGLKTDIRALLKGGRSPLILGGVVSLTVAVVSIAVQYLLGVV